MVVFTSMIAALALQGVAAPTSEVQVRNVRPSKIVARIEGAFKTECRLQADDHKSVIRLTGTTEAREELANWIHTFDVKPAVVVFTTQLVSRLDKLAYDYVLSIPNLGSLSFTESTTGVQVELAPRINGDGTITLDVTTSGSLQPAHVTLRLKQGQSLALYGDQKGIKTLTVASTKVPAVDDPVILFTPKIKTP